MTVGGSIYGTLSNYSKSFRGDAEPKVNGFAYDPRRGMNRALRGPVQTPLVVRAQVDGVVTKLRVPRGATMDQVGALIVGGCGVQRHSVLNVRVEQVAWTEGRSSQKIAHLDYSRALLRVVQVIQARLAPTPVKTPPRRRMRTLNNSVYVPAGGKLYPQLQAVAGVSPQRVLLEPTPELSPEKLARLGSSYKVNDPYYCDATRQRSILERGPLETAARRHNLRDPRGVWNHVGANVAADARPLPHTRSIFGTQLDAARQLHAGIRRTGPLRGAQFTVARARTVHVKSDLRADCPHRRLEGVEQAPFDYADAYRPDPALRVTFGENVDALGLDRRAVRITTPELPVPLGHQTTEGGLWEDRFADEASLDTVLSPDRQTSLMSGLETYSVTSVPQGRYRVRDTRSIDGVLANTHSVRMPGSPGERGSFDSAASVGPELSIDRLSATGSDLLSVGGGSANLHNLSYYETRSTAHARHANRSVIAAASGPCSETGDLFVNDHWSGEGYV
jgi:hypothetical protein